ncbi:hypothetical protein [Noviherbaspirillum sp.]|uniref:hypothetical protein n=1 Tax=Noviherbaspirillum sp. TaxID=1926288 RepID=UPI002B497523|nr:hypothetical protein [Noviherbaspirillum sp.]HJV82441.1 hypothetical protein [Noviherbaspirillum sp.]
MRQPPKKGLYTSTKTAPGKQFVVENVTVVEDEDEGGVFFLVDLVDAADAADMSASGMELDTDEWFEMVDEYGLVEGAGKP